MTPYSSLAPLPNNLELAPIILFEYLINGNTLHRHQSTKLLEGVFTSFPEKAERSQLKKKALYSLHHSTRDIDSFLCQKRAALSVKKKLLSPGQFLRATCSPRDFGTKFLFILAFCPMADSINGASMAVKKTVLTRMPCDAWSLTATFVIATTPAFVVL